MTLLQFNQSNHLLSLTLRLTTPATSAKDGRRSSTSSNSGLPNPFKVLKTLSAEQATSVEDERRISRIEVGDPHDLGVVLLDGSVLGVRTCLSLDGEVIRIIVWSDQEILVCCDGDSA